MRVHSTGAAAAAIVLHGCLIVYGIVRTETVVRVNHLFPYADKLWHALYYALLAGLLYAVFRRRTPALVALALFAVIDEGVQALTPGRSASLRDLVVDMLVGAAVVWWLSRRRALRLQS